MSRGKLWGVALWRGLCAIRSLGAFAIALFATACLVVPSASASVPSTAIRYFYTPNNRLSAVIKPEAEYGLYTWDAAGNLSSIARKSSTKLSIIQLEPTKGAVGETVDIWGTGFSTTLANDTVKFHGTAATVTAATADTLAVKVPTGATTGTVTVQTTTEGPVTSSQTFTVGSVVGAPTITSISSSLATAGTTITMSGTNFETTASNDVVKVNETDAELTSESSTSIKFKVPENASGGPVSIITPQGSAKGPNLFIPPSGVTTGQVGPMVSLSAGSPSTVNITTAKTVGLALVEGNGGQPAALLFSHVTMGQGYAKLYTPTNAKLPESQVFDSGKESLLEPVTLPATGTYTVMLEPLEEDTGSVQVTEYPESDVVGSLSPSTSGASEVVSLSTPGQIATYSVSVTAGEEVSLKTSESTFTGGYYLEWYTPEGLLFSYRHFNGNEFMDSVEFPTTGTYKLEVKPEGAATGSAKLTAYNSTVQTTSITPSSGGESKTITTSIPGQNVKVTFSGTSGEKVSLVLAESTINNGAVSILGPEGENVGGETTFSNEESKEGRLIGPVTLPATGTYTIFINPFEAYTGSVKLSAYSVVDVTGTISPSTGGTTETVALPDPGQTATYSVSGTAGEEVSLKTSENTFTGEYHVEWYNPEGKIITYRLFYGNEFMHAVTFPTTGTYKLVISPVGTATGSLKLTAYNATAVTGSITPTSGGESKTVTLSVPGQRAKITFSGTTEQEVSVVVSEVAITAGFVSIDNPEGSRIAGEDSFSTGYEATLGPVKLSATGTYTILIEPNEADTGSVKLTAYIGSPPHGLVVKRGPAGTASTALMETSPDTPPSAMVDISALTASQRPFRASTSSAMLERRVEDQLPSGRARGVRLMQGSRARATLRRPHPSGRARRYRRNAPRDTRGVFSKAAMDRANGSALPPGPMPPVFRSFRASGSGQWYPSAGTRKGLAWRTELPGSPWAKLAPLRAADNATSLAGQALKLNGLPLAGLRVWIENTAITGTTDGHGQFLLQGVPAGHRSSR